MATDLNDKYKESLKMFTNELKNKFENECINVKYSHFKENGDGNVSFFFNILDIETWKQNDICIEVRNINEYLYGSTGFLSGRFVEAIRAQLMFNFNQTFQSRSKDNQSRKFGNKKE